MKITLPKIGNLCGVLAPVLWAAAIIYGGSLRPEYSHYSQYISELGERGSSTEFIMRYGAFVPTGLMHIAFAAFLSTAFKDSPVAKFAALLIAVNGIARIGAGTFPCEVGCSLPRLMLSQKLHSLSAGVGFFALIGASLLWGILIRRYHSLRGLSAYSIVSGCLALVFLALMSWSAELRMGTGLYERLSTGLLSLWMFVFAARLWWLKAYSVSPGLY
ncbi:DUF998 domain-containing protein [Methyloglobulus sp.]|uniref:DUF998 domain-containing protein n=1 Tax=Methyloglobulus sp. TaxID=2518622 RepID=UPI0039898E2C